MCMYTLQLACFNKINRTCVCLFFNSLENGHFPLRDRRCNIIHVHSLTIDFINRLQKAADTLTYALKLILKACS